MSRILFSSGLLRKTVIFSVAFLALFAQVAQAHDDDDNDNPLRFFKNYFVTGDYVSAGVSLRGTGRNGFATGRINMNAVPCTGKLPNGTTGYVGCGTVGALPAGIVAAFLYWETEETTSIPSATNGFFRGNAIVGKVLGSPDNAACLSSGGPYGTNHGRGRVYRADVMRYLAIDSINNVQLGNGQHEVKLPDSGGNGNGNAPFTNGATLVVIYRIVVPGLPHFAPIRAVVSYDGAQTVNKSSDEFFLKMGGFYQASSSPAAKMTPIVANGQSNFRESFYINTGYRTAAFYDPFRGSVGGRWDSPTFPVNLDRNDDDYSVRLYPGNNQVCLTLAAIWTSTNVVDSDYDGLLDVWETKGLHLDPGDDRHAASFGTCYDDDDRYDDDYHHHDDRHRQPCVDLKAMGANPSRQDIFVELDWMKGSDGHQHFPKYAALSAMGQTFALHGIALHFDVGRTEYRGSPFIVPAAYARGGDVIDESQIRCRPITVGTRTSTCAFSEPYSVLSWKKGMHAIEAGFRALGIPRHFDENRKDAFHYVLFAHALAGPFGPTGEPLTSDPSSVSGVADRPGGDVMITLGLWRFDDPIHCDPRTTCADQTGSVLVQAGTLMHELGHNFGLSHAGLYRGPNCIPIYPSVMNYLYQTRGLTGADNLEHIDYSRGTLKPLDEKLLSDNSSLGPLPYRIRFYGPPLPGEGAARTHCDGTLITDGPLGGALAVRIEGSGLSTPDWNRNGIRDAGPYQQDVNYSSSLQDGVAGGKLFVDSDDWRNLNLQQMGARRNVNGLSSDVGEADLGEADLGEADLGEADLGEADLGEADLGEADLGEADLGEADLGKDVDYDNVIASLDATSSESPLVATSKIDRITLAWGTPSIGQIRHYHIWRSDPANPTPAHIGQVDSPTPDVTPATTWDDVVNDFTHSGSSCSGTCYNTLYTYYIIAEDVHGTPSGKSNNAPSEVTHLFVLANPQSVVYGNTPPNPASGFQIFGDGNTPPLAGASCAYAVSPAIRNVGSYVISCAGPASANSTTGVTYNVAYMDGLINRTPGALSVTKRPITVKAVFNSKIYDGGISSTAVPTLAPGSSLAYSDSIAAWTEIYDSKNVGNSHVMTISPMLPVSDGNGGLNYEVTRQQSTATGTITPAPLTIAAVTNSKTYDGNTSAAAHPTVTGLQPGDATTPVLLVETYTDKNAGTNNKTLTVSPYTIDDGNSGNNYAVTVTAFTTGTIDKADATFTVTPYHVTYNGSPHSAAYSTITGVNGESGALVGAVTLDTTHTAAGTYSSDSWSFTGGSNYNNQSSTPITDIIDKADATFTVTPYHVTYDGSPHTAAYSTITGVNGESGGLVGAVTLNTHTNAGTYASDSWSFTGGSNYNDQPSTPITDIIDKADATFTVTPYNVTYDGGPHTATYSTITGVNGETGALVGAVVTLNTTHTNAGTYSSDSWSFTGGSNYNDKPSTPITDVINKADATIVVTPYHEVFHSEHSHTAAGTARGVLGESLSGLSLSGTTHTAVGNYDDAWEFTDVTGNYNNAHGFLIDTIYYGDEE